MPLLVTRHPLPKRSTWWLGLNDRAAQSFTGCQLECTGVIGEILLELVFCNEMPFFCITEALPALLRSSKISALITTSPHPCRCLQSRLESRSESQTPKTIEGPVNAQTKLVVLV